MNDKKGVIYKITNVVNDKKYIGQTTNYKERIRHHKQTAYRKNSTHKDKPLYEDIRKFGLENFKFEIIEEVDDIDLIDAREIYWIDFYKSCVDFGGYNLDKGGKNGLKSNETKQKMSKSQSGENNPSYGKTGGKSQNAISVINITKNIIYPSMVDCAISEFGDRKHMKQISKVCDPKSNRKTYKGNVYRKFDKNGNIIEKESIFSNDVFQRVSIKDTISGKTFESISQAAKYFNISQNMVRDRIYNRVKNDKYKNEFQLTIIK